MEQQTVTYSNTKSCFHVDVEQQAGLFCAPTICFFLIYIYAHVQLSHYIYHTLTTFINCIIHLLYGCLPKNPSEVLILWTPLGI